MKFDSRTLSVIICICLWTQEILESSFYMTTCTGGDGVRLLSIYALYEYSMYSAVHFGLVVVQWLSVVCLNKISSTRHYYAFRYT